MNWISNYVRPKINSLFSRREVPENLWTKCDECGTMLFHRELAANLNVCTSCEHHMPITPRTRFSSLFDGGIFTEVDGSRAGARPAPLPRPEAIPAASARGPARDRREGGDAGGRGRDRPHAGHLRGAGLLVHGRIDGDVCRQRDHRRLRACGGAAAAADPVLRRRRRPDAGRHPFADADAAHDGRGGDAEGSASALHRGADASDDGRASRRPMPCWATSRSPSPAR